MIKVIKLAAAAGLTCLIANSALASGLLLCTDSSVQSNVNVACGPVGGPYINTGYPIPAKGGCVLGSVDLPWGTIKNFLKGNNGECTFTPDGAGAAVGHALVNLQGNPGKMQGALYSVNLQPPYKVSYPGGYTPGPQNFASEIKVTVSQSS